LNLVTLSTDFGETSHHLASAKGQLYRSFPGVQVVDINHSISACDINEASFILDYVYEDFPDGTIHILGVDALHRLEHAGLLVMKMAEQFFIGYNHGLLPLIDPNASRSYYLLDGFLGNHFDWVKLAAISAVKVILQNSLSDFTCDLSEVYTKGQIQPVVFNDMLQGQVVYIGQRGLAHTNIQQNEFETFLGKAKPLIHLTRHETVTKICTHLLTLKKAELGCFFNKRGYLCAGFYQDDTRALLAFRYGTPVRIEKLHT
jgi:S-adenosylmethionine hydrolase